MVSLNEAYEDIPKCRDKSNGKGRNGVHGLQHVSVSNRSQLHR